MIEQKLENILKKFAEIGQKLSEPDIVSDIKKYTELMREHKGMEILAQKAKEFLDLQDQIVEYEEIISENGDVELVEMARLELPELGKMKISIAAEIELLLLPKDPNDSKNTIVEIRAGTGGEEAGLFAGDLFRMYTKFADARRWKKEILSSNETGIGGFKEIIFLLQGDGAYGLMKFESGVHRVQRIPATESGGRVHTSAATVAVLPEAKAVDIVIDPNDLKIDVYRSSGPGGQSVNTTDSAVRITHIPTGMVVTCQDEKSQHKNKDRALKVLSSRLLQYEQEKQQSKISAQRKSMVSTGDRSAKIRTYNFPQGRVTDHRINLTLYNLQEILNGALEELIEKLRVADQAMKLEQE